MSTSGYVYDQSWGEERRRLAGIEALWDPGSQELLTRAGAAPGANVLEAGAGGGALVEWLADRVGPGGRVLAVDIDTRFLQPLASDTVEVHQLDLVNDELPQAEFDLVHARLLLEHLPARDQVLDRLVGALRPGGRILIEDYDWRSFGFDPAGELDEQAVEGILSFMAAAGFDRDYGRRIAGELRRRGLQQIRGEGRLLAIDETHPGFEFFRLSFEQIAPAAVQAGTLGAETARVVGERLPHAGIITPALMAASGTRAG